MHWVTIVSAVVLVAGLIGWIVFVRKSLARDAEEHAKGKKSRDHLSTYGEPPES